MTAATWFGLALTLLAGLLAGNCMLPMKFVRRWQWENTWLIFTLVSLVFCPWLLAIILVPGLGHVYASLPPREFAVPLLFGFGWGIAQALFGLSVVRLGLALSYAIIIGLGASLGTLIPLFFSHGEVVGTVKGALILSGVGVMIAGIVVASIAGRQRERAARAGETTRFTGSYRLALLTAIVCGLAAPMINFAFAFGQSIADAAVRQGVPPERAAYAVWPVALTGGLLPNLGYSVYLLHTRRTWKHFWFALPEGGLATLMGVFWMGSMAVYGVSSVHLGVLGTSVGWALFQIFMIMTANASGLLTGEWRGAPASAVRRLGIGLLLLAVATAIIAAGNSYALPASSAG
jgi:L-rhamnose-H+ transport protein